MGAVSPWVGGMTRPSLRPRCHQNQHEGSSKTIRREQGREDGTRTARVHSYTSPGNVKKHRKLMLILPRAAVLTRTTDLGDVWREQVAVAFKRRVSSAGVNPAESR